MAALEKGNYELDKKKLAVHVLIADLKKSWDMKLERGQIVLRLNASNHLIIGDAQHLSNAFQNLIENAVKYNHADPLITVETKSNERTVLIEVKDNGIGIAPQHQKKLFDKFFRVPKGDLHEIKGFGLGLSYVKTIVDKHHGRISVRSQSGEGSVFAIEFPLAG